MPLAIFDLDNTLLAGDSDHAWGEFISSLGVVDGQAYSQQNDAYYADYCRGALDIFAYQRFVMSPLTGRPRAELEAWHQQFMRDHILPIVLPAAQARIESHRQQGHILMIITATNTFITAPIARHFGIEHLLATEPEIQNGLYTGNLVGTPCYREGKVERLQQWMTSNGHTLEDSWFYSDSHNDLPLLSCVTHPVAVDPDDTLRQHASQAGWPVISLR
jgi:HAD superfamily hydrolase (TIGR01490 family)